MANLTEDRVTDELASQAMFNSDPIAAATQVYKGAMAGLDAAGNIVPAAPATPVMRGVVTEGVDNSGGIAGALNVSTKKGVFRFNQTGLDRTNIGEDVFVVDDNTVGAAGTLVAGRLEQIDAAGAWVKIA